MNRSFTILATALTLPLLQVGCVTTSASGPADRQQAEADHLIKRGNQLIALGERMQKQAQANLTNGQDLVKKGNEMKAGGTAPAISAPAAAYPAATNTSQSNY